MKFSTIEEGQALLGKSDAFIERLSPFDRASRLQTDNEVTTEFFLEHVVGCVE